MAPFLGCVWMKQNREFPWPNRQYGINNRWYTNSLRCHWYTIYPIDGISQLIIDGIYPNNRWFIQNFIGILLVNTRQ